MRKNQNSKTQRLYAAKRKAGVSKYDERELKALEKQRDKGKLIFTDSDIDKLNIYRVNNGLEAVTRITKKTKGFDFIAKQRRKADNAKIYRLRLKTGQNPTYLPPPPQQQPSAPKTSAAAVIVSQQSGTGSFLEVLTYGALDSKILAISSKKKAKTSSPLEFALVTATGKTTLNIAYDGVPTTTETDLFKITEALKDAFANAMYRGSSTQVNWQVTLFDNLDLIVDIDIF